MLQQVIFEKKWNRIQGFVSCVSICYPIRFLYGPVYTRSDPENCIRSQCETWPQSETTHGLGRIKVKIGLSDTVQDSNVH